MDMAWTKIKSRVLGGGSVAVACGQGLTGQKYMAQYHAPKRGARATAAPQPKRPGTTEILLQPPAPAKPGDRLVIEVLEALPGRPISGERLVRPDGTISLSFYGDLKVAGLTRQEIKAMVVEHLRKFLPDEVLGLVETDEDGKLIRVDPKDTNRVFVDDSRNYEADAPRKLRSGEDSDRFDLSYAERRVLEAIESLKSPASSGRPSDRETAKRLADHERRLGEIETKLDRLIQAIESLKSDEKR
jgi:hypothetical protein